MYISLTSGGVGFFTRFAIALAVIICLKAKNKTDRELDRGLKLLIGLGVATLLLTAVIVGCWLAFFGAPFSLLPYFFGYFHY